MNARELVALGLPQECAGVAYEALKASGRISQPTEATLRIGEVLAEPEDFATDPHFGTLAKSVVAIRTQLEESKDSWGRNPHGAPAAFAQWGGARRSWHERPDERGVRTACFRAGRAHAGQPSRLFNLDGAEFML
jgi:hypothetical protein